MVVGLDQISAVQPPTRPEGVPGPQHCHTHHAKRTYSDRTGLNATVTRTAGNPVLPATYRPRAPGTGLAAIRPQGEGIVRPRSARPDRRGDRLARRSLAQYRRIDTGIAAAGRAVRYLLGLAFLVPADGRPRAGRTRRAARLCRRGDGLQLPQARQLGDGRTP